MGSYCLVTESDKKNPRKIKSFFPIGVCSVSDQITIIDEMLNSIPDKSWMLYLLEIFNAQDIALELNLICQFDGQDYFEAIFRGVNQYRFVNVLPVIGHTYNRQILLDSQEQTIRYSLADKDNGQYEIYDLSTKNLVSFNFQGSRHFTGIEWWNRMKNSPYPVKFEIEISQLLFGLSDYSSGDFSATFYPYNALLPNDDGSKGSYPVSMQNLRIKDDGCLSYQITSGRCSTGIRYGC